MKSSRRVLAALALAVGLAPWAAQIAGCGNDAVGIDACKMIEQERCELAPKCAGEKGSPSIKTKEQVDNCVSYYKDHCLVGLENITKDPVADSVAKACVAAIKATVACKTSGQASMETCAGVGVDDASLTPCQVFTAPEHLDDCRFIETPSTSSTVTSTTATVGGAGGAGGVGGAIAGGLAVTSGG